MIDNALFFSEMPVHHLPLSVLLGREELFVDVPESWHVVVTDIKNSTLAHREGRHEEVNLIATGSIIATLNLARRANLAVPFFFGGDGATMIVPPPLLAPLIGALNQHRELTLMNFGMDLRVGAVSVSALRDAGHELRISRLHVTDYHAITILLGSGLSEAERRVKGEEGVRPAVTPDDLLDLSGMECRWDRIKPPHAGLEVVCLLVTAGAGRSQAPIFRRVIDLIDTTYGPPAARNPVTIDRLQLRGTLQKIGIEMRARLGRFSLPYLIKSWLITRAGGMFYFALRAGNRYKKQLVEQTDTLVIDGRINTVIAGTARQRAQLADGLSVLERNGEIAYGMFVCRESVMSCYVTDRTDRHIHFVDGSDGGYTMAATELKRKLRRNAT
ncbi:MAG: DUF3095 family protein [Rhodothermales bacterium]|nr:DUF3095 family protein [Rhodothermales bacterium]